MKSLLSFTGRTGRTVGQPPGSLVFTGIQKTKTPTFEIIRFNKEDYFDLKSNDLEEVLKEFDDNQVNWININGIHKTDNIRRIGDFFNIHNLILEDILNTGHLPKIEEFDDYLFVTLKMLSVSPERAGIISEHFSFVISDRYVISFQEYEGDLFETVRERLKTQQGKGRQRGPDYLFYLLADKIIDHYFVVVDEIGTRLEKIEDDVIYNPSEDVAFHIMEQRKTLIHFMKFVSTFREDMRTLLKEPGKLISEVTLDYLFDLKDHLLEINHSIEAAREDTSNLLDLHNTYLSKKMNNVMMTLTVIATVFIPLTFIAGIYGMNFSYMPELQWKWGYPAVIGFMALTGIAMGIYMRKRKWF